MFKLAEEDVHTLGEEHGSKLRSCFDRHNLAVFLVIIREIYGSVTVTFVKNRQIAEI